MTSTSKLSCKTSLRTRTAHFDPVLCEDKATSTGTPDRTKSRPGKTEITYFTCLTQSNTHPPSPPFTMTNSSDWVYLPNSIKLDPAHGPPIKDLGGEGWVLLSALISFPGMFLCPLLGFAILSKKKLQSTANMLIVIMSMTDWANSLLGFMMFGATYVMGHFPRQAWACHLMGFLYPTLAMTTFYILGLLTYERFCIFVKNKPINKKKAYLSVQVVFVLLGIYSALPWITNNAVGRDELKAHGGACFVGGGEGVIEQDWMIFFNVVLFMITAAVMIYFYARIYLHIKVRGGRGGGRVFD